jgi:hypothetical protein
MTKKLRTAPRHYFLVALLLLLGAAIYSRGFVGVLPYQLHSDEPRIYQFGVYLYDTGTFMNRYPPLRVAELALEFWMLDLVTPGGASQMMRFLVARYFSILYGVLTLAVAYRAARALHSPAAGLAAMIFLIAQPDAYRFAKVFKVDNLAWLAGMLALCLSLITARKPRWWAISLAVVAGIAAVLGKYTMVPILIPAGVVLLLYVPRTPRARLLLIGLVAGVVAVGTWVLFHPPTFFMNFHARQLYTRESVITFVSLKRAWPHLLDQLGRVNFWGVIVALPFAVLVWPRSRFDRTQGVMVVTLVVMVVATYLMNGLFETNRVQERYVIVLGFALLWGLTVALLAHDRRLVALILALILLAPWLQKAWHYGSNQRRPDTRALTADWFIEQVPEGVHIAVEYDRVEFDPGYGGYPGEKIFFVETITSVHEDSLANFARRGVEYLVADERNIHRRGFYDDSSDNAAFLSQTEVALSLDDPYNNGMVGPRRIIFRVPPIQQVPMHVFLGDAIIFKGYDLAAEVVTPGESLDLVLYWAALRETGANYTVFAHLLDADGALVSQFDGLPGDSLHRTYDWWPGYFDWDEWPVPVPEDLAPGTYTLRVGMYDADTVERLPAVDADGTSLGDSILLGPITVVEGQGE